MNIAYFTEYRSWWQNKMFDANADCNSNNVLDRYIALRKYLAERNINLNTFDMYGSMGEVDIWILQEPTPGTVKFMHDNKIDPSRVIFFLHEPYVYNRWGWDYIQNSHFFHKAILSWESTFPQKDKKFFHYHFPVTIDLSRYEHYSNNKKENLALIMHSNKTSKEEGELYSFRRQVMRYFENRGDYLLDLFGHGWNDNTRDDPFFTNIYKGTTPDKFETYSKYYYSFCIDNCIIPGYITYDPLISMATGTVPIYVPMPDSIDFIPENTFIDLLKFESFDELYERMISIIKTKEYEEYRRNGREFLGSEKFYTFTNKKYCEDIYKAVEYLDNYLNSESFTPSVYLNKESVVNKLNPHFTELFYTENGSVLNRVKPITLINHRRIDVIAKYIYVKYFDKSINTDWASNLYDEHIRVFNGHDEKDGSGKKGRDSFVISFNKIISSIKDEGFNEEKSMLPVSFKNGLIEGAHRLAASLYYNKTVSTLTFSHEGWLYDYNYFRNKGLSEESLDSIALEYCMLIKDLKTVMLFPSAVGKTDEVIPILKEAGEIYYYKELQLKNNGPLYLMMQVYKGEEWLGKWENFFSGAKSKANYCFKTDEPLRFFLFKPFVGVNIIELKEKIRKIYNIAKHSVHINDTHEESIRITSTLLNKNSVHFLNNVKLNTFAKFQSLFDYFDKITSEKGINNEDLCLTGSTVLALYGLRDANDLDYIKAEKSNLTKINDDIKAHDSELKYYPTNFDNIVYNPENHFYFNGVKFASLNIVRLLKENRGEAKDIKDVELINTVLPQSEFNAIDEAQKFIYENKFKEAAEILVQHIKHHPGNINALNHAADCFMNLGDKNTASAITNIVLKLDSSNKAAQKNLSDMNSIVKEKELKNENAPRFSIIMANYNGSKYIEEAINSVLAQTFVNWELIIVDDCSTDDSVIKIKKYLGDERIILIQHETNKKYITALTTGISKVKSKYFGTLDSDDALVPEAVETMYNAHQENSGAGFIYSQFLYCDENLKPQKLGYCAEVQKNKTNLDTDTVSHFRTFKLDYYLRSAQYDITILHAEDKDISYKMEEVGELKFIDKPLYLYRELACSISHVSDNRKLSIQTMLKAKINALSRRKETCGLKNKIALDNYKKAGECLNKYDFTNAEKLINLFKNHFDYNSLPKHDKRDNASPELSVIIVAYKTGKSLLECVESIMKNKRDNYEIIVIDNGGNEEAVPNLLQMPLLYIVLPENINPAEGRNIGAHFAKGDILVFVDDDSVVPGNYLEKIYVPFQAQDVKGVKGRVVPRSKEVKIIPLCYDLGDEPIPTSITTEGNSAFRKDVYLKLGGMNPLLFGHEGVELSFRLYKQTKSFNIIYWPEAVIYHDPASDDKNQSKLSRYEVMNKYLEWMHPEIWQFNYVVEEFGKINNGKALPAPSFNFLNGYKINTSVAKEFHGTEYGGWFISPFNLDRDSIVYSFGLGEDISFDLSIIEKYGVTVHGFDPTPKSIDWLKKQNINDSFKLYDYGIADFNGTVKFYPPENPDHVSHTLLYRSITSMNFIEVPVKSISSIMKELKHSKIDLLKMDIEGAEYSVLEDILKNKINVSQILVEFHDRFEGVGKDASRVIIKKLINNGYDIFSISPLGNEYSFIRTKDFQQKLCKQSENSFEYPVILITYNRPEHTKKVLNALRKHNIKNLYVFSDAPKTQEHVEGVIKTRKFIEEINWTNPVKVYQTQNQGLAKSIVNAVNLVFEKHDKLVLLEDDCVPQKHFFNFMNDCLNKYENEKSVFGISGYSVQIPKEIRDNYNYDLYFSPRIGSWGWATWKSKWQMKNDDLRSMTKNILDSGIDLTQAGSDVPVMLLDMLNGNLKDVWTMPWLLTVYANKGYYIYPIDSHIENIGMDGTGVHCGATDKFNSETAQKQATRFPEKVFLDEKVSEVFKSFYDLPVQLPLENKTSTGLKVAHICTQDNGGAGTAAYLLNKGLNELGVDSKLIVLNKTKNDNSVLAVPDDYSVHKTLLNEIYSSQKNQLMWQRFYQIMNSFPERPKEIEIFSTPESNVDLSEVQEIIEADIINLHWVAGMINYEDVKELFKDKTIVWTLHDMNAFTGGCHYADTCRKFTEECGACPQLGSKDENDISSQIWKYKKSIYDDLNITVVTPSKWLGEQASQSSLFKKYKREVIPYGFELDVFKPQNDELNRKEIGVPANAKIILFGATYNNKRKGFEYLVKALTDFNKTDFNEEIYLAVFGNIGDFQNVLSGYKILNFGAVNDPEVLAKIYSLADVFVIPSLEDNLPLVVVESLACGTPVVGFNIGGIPDMIQHKLNGYIAEEKNAADLSNGITWCLRQDKKILTQNSVKTAGDKFTLLIQAERYLELYKKIHINNNIDGNELNKNEITRNDEMKNQEIEESIKSGNYTNAIQLLQEVINKNPSDTEALNNLAVVLSILGENESAIRTLNLVLKIDPQNEVAADNLKTISV